MSQTMARLAARPSGGSLSGKMKAGSSQKIRPFARPVTAEHWGFTLHRAQLSSLPDAPTFAKVTLTAREQILLHLAK